MGILEAIILISAISNFILGFFVFLKNPSKLINRLFGTFGFVTAFWVFANLMMGIQNTLFWLKSAYAFGALVPISALIWVFELCEIKIIKSKIFLLSGLGLLFFVIAYLNDLIVANVKRVYLGGFEGDTGSFFPFYTLYVFGILGFVIYLLFSEYYRAKEIKKLQISYVIIGAILYIGIVLIVSFILPLFGILKFTALDSPSSLFLVFFTTLAITRYHLFEIRVLLTELLVAVMGIILLVLPFLMPTFNLRILTLTVFILFLIFGYYLVRATHEESKRREGAEKLAIQEKALREKAERFKIVSTKLKEKLSEVLELELILSNIKEVLAETFQTKKFSFGHKQPTSDFYEIRKINGFQKEEPSSIIIQTPLCAYLEKEKEILTQEKLSFLIEKEKDESEKEKMSSILQKLKESEIQLVLPLFQKNAIIGIFFLGQKLSGKSYTQEDIELLEGLSYQMAISIQNSLLYEEIKKDKEALERFYKLTVGRELKMAELKDKIKGLEEKLEEKQKGDKIE